MFKLKGRTYKFILSERRWQQSLKHFNNETISAVQELHSCLQGLTQHRVQNGLSHAATQMWDDGKCTCKGIFRLVRFPCDTFTAKDLKGDNMHDLQHAEESDSNTWATRDKGQLMPRSPSSATLCIIPQPTLWGMLSSFVNVWMINHISYKMSIPCHKYSYSQNSHLCVSNTLLRQGK